MWKARASVRNDPRVGVSGRTEAEEQPSAIPAARIDARRSRIGARGPERSERMSCIVESDGSSTRHGYNRLPFSLPIHPRRPFESQEDPLTPETVREEFRRRFGGEARIFFAPGRVNLLGAHLDYNGGPVLPVALPVGTFVAGRRRDDGRFRFLSRDAPDGLEVRSSGIAPDPAHGWANYPKGAVRMLGERLGDLPGADLLFASTLPIGAGLSSSASITLGCAWAVNALSGGESSREDLVDVALRAERDFVGVRCGIMDPYVSAFGRRGHVLHLDCKRRAHEYLPFDEGAFSLLVADTGRRRGLADSGFNRRVEQCESALAKLREGDPSLAVLADVSPSGLEASRDRLSDEEERRARHVVEETARVGEGVECLRRGDLGRFGALVDASHASSRDLYGVSSSELDRLAEAARGAGALGARLSGGGFAGCVVALVPRTGADTIAREVAERYLAEVGIEPRLRVFSPADGAREWEGA